MNERTEFIRLLKAYPQLCQRIRMILTQTTLIPSRPLASASVCKEDSNE